LTAPKDSFSNVFLRPLEEEDAVVSFQWRKDAKVWEHTFSSPPKELTLEDELNWIRAAIERKDQKRWAICLKPSGRYVGNIQLTSINSDNAEFHIFIGATDQWGKGIGRKAMELLFEMVSKDMTLSSIYLYVRKSNERAIKLYERMGMVKASEKKDECKYSINFDRKAIDD
jgi:diamine N-acetyltransferase